MLQQTQVSRVVDKFSQFIDQFPDLEALSNATLPEVLRLWSGLGYNRRARYLHEAAKTIIHDHTGQFPSSIKDLTALPGIGKNTAGAIVAYSFNEPVVFIETNIRTVYMHHFFHDDTLVSDQQIQELVEATLDQEHPREFYWALMDYGAELKRQGFGGLDKSLHHKKQSPLKGSVREVRGLIIKHLTEGELPLALLKQRLPNDERFQKAVDGLVRDRIVSVSGETIRLAAF